MAMIVQDVERQKGGLRPAAQLTTVEALVSLADEYRTYLLDLGRTEQHADDTRRRIVAVARDCQWTTVADVTLGRWVRWVGQARGDGSGFSAETINHHLRSLRAFFRWLVQEARIPADPLAGAKLLNADADRRIRRRVLSPDEFRRFIDSTRASTVRRVHLDGPSRAALYLMAARTGLRSAVLARLTPESLRLEHSVPHIPVEARRQKSRKALSVPIPRAVLEELRSWLESRGSGPLWPGKWHIHGHASSMVYRDLRDAGLEPDTPDGQFDFQALRGQCATDIARAGVPLSVTQAYLGHSSPTVTAKHYLHVGLEDLGAAADRLGSGLGKQSPTEPNKIGKPKGQKGRGKK